MDEICCKHLKMEDTYDRDIYGHPIYKYYCTKRNKETLFLVCIRCKDNTTKEEVNDIHI